ncbi:MAG: FAD-dependent oxidoreductase [Acidimicrobiales bacterium]
MCAQDLTRAGVHCRVLEACDGVGGRVRTDKVDGFLLDRGFQVVLTGYPQVQQRFDVDALELCVFEPGALVRVGGGFHRVGDPLRRPLQIPRTVVAPIGTLVDKARLARMVIDVRGTRFGGFSAGRIRRPRRGWRTQGFSSRMIESFWQLLFAGIQLDPQLEVSSRRFDVILRMLSIGATGVPRLGIGALAAQLGSTLPDDTLRLGARVVRVDESGALFEDGERADSGTDARPRRREEWPGEERRRDGRGCSIIRAVWPRAPRGCGARARRARSHRHRSRA